MKLPYKSYSENSVLNVTADAKYYNLSHVYPPKKSAIKSQGLKDEYSGVHRTLMKNMAFNSLRAGLNLAWAVYRVKNPELYFC